MRFCWDPPTETRVHWEKKGGKCMGEGHKKLNFPIVWALRSDRSSVRASWY